MIALLTTYLIVAYILIPGVLFRVPATFFIQLRLFQLTKTEEATVGCLVALFPFLLALFFVWNVPLARNHPFEYPKTNSLPYKDVYRHAFTLVTAENPAALLEKTNGEPTVYESVLVNIAHRQMRFVTWYYIFILIEGGLFGYWSSKYGDWSDKTIPEWLIRKVMLPRVCEWQLLFTDFLFPKKESRAVFADALCVDDHLYRGRIEDYFLDKAGDLSGILMKEVERFRRKDYEEARAAVTAGSVVKKEEFWREIPGANFYIPAAQIANLNLRFPYESNDDLLAYLRKTLVDNIAKGAVITVGTEEPTQNLNSSAADISDRAP